MKKESKQVTLVLTEQCNLNCVYCYENNKSSRSMTWDTARTIIDNELRDADEYDRVIVDLFGGEPFLNFHLLKQIVEYVNSQKHDNVTFKTTTNGTLVHGEVQEWLIAHRSEFSLGLSLDGSKETHDINRTCSFDKIDLEFFLQFFKDEPIKMTISPSRIGYLSEDVIFCHEKGFNVNCNLAVGQDWGEEGSIKQLNEQLYLLIDYYIENPQIKPCSLINEGIMQVGLDLPLEATKWCGVGTNMHTYDVEGKCYPCHYFLPNSIGTDRSFLSRSIEFKEKFSLNLLNEKCRNCIIREACPTCYGSNYLLTGNPYKKDDIFCKQVKAIIKARAFFWAKLWELNRLPTLSETEENLLLSAILKIQEV